ncbi:hypothetical protein [Chondromyces crocatus]|uniref:hypothetical protein n=1 Tax=Chondromyces crocatus TaxID=52 RepID=UPI00067C2D01|nr:hypothetical protein [Chondromyces crocatus]
MRARAGTGVVDEGDERVPAYDVEVEPRWSSSKRDLAHEQLGMASAGDRHRVCPVALDDTLAAQGGML